MRRCDVALFVALLRNNGLVAHGLSLNSHLPGNASSVRCGNGDVGIRAKAFQSRGPPVPGAGAEAADAKARRPIRTPLRKSAVGLLAAGVTRKSETRNPNRKVPQIMPAENA